VNAEVCTSLSHPDTHTCRRRRRRRVDRRMEQRRRTKYMYSKGALVLPNYVLC
jgi:hypothetical protein